MPRGSAWGCTGPWGAGHECRSITPFPRREAVDTSSHRLGRRRGRGPGHVATRVLVARSGDRLCGRTRRDRGRLIGFAVADGRWRVIALECSVAMAFVVIAAAGITGPTWLLVLGFAAHGLKDAWQQRAQYVSGTRWWPPFCAAVDLVVAPSCDARRWPAAAGRSIHDPGDHDRRVARGRLPLVAADRVWAGRLVQLRLDRQRRAAERGAD
jgi:hypothetical protein